jgi:hypothetical protein
MPDACRTIDGLWGVKGGVRRPEHRESGFVGKERRGKRLKSIPVRVMARGERLNDAGRSIAEADVVILPTLPDAMACLRGKIFPRRNAARRAYLEGPQDRAGTG